MYVLVCTVLLETRPSIHMNKLIMLESCAHTYSTYRYGPSGYRNKYFCWTYINNTFMTVPVTFRY